MAAGWRVGLWFSRIDAIWWHNYRTLLLRGFKLGTRLSPGGEKPTSFNKDYTSSGEAITDFFFLTKISFSCKQSCIRPWHKDGRQVLVETLVFGNSNGCKKVIRPVSVLDEWMRDMTDIGSNVHHANILGQAWARALQYQSARCLSFWKCTH